MISRVLAMIRKEFVQIVRDRRTLAIVLVLPGIQILIFGYAINTTVDHIPFVVFDQSLDRPSRELIQSFVNSGYFDLVGSADSAAGIRGAIDRGDAKVGIVIPPDYSRNVSSGESAPVQVVIDGSDPNLAQTATFAAGNIIQSRSIDLVSRGRKIDIPIDFRPTVLYNAGMQSVNFMIPGLIGAILQFQTLVLTAFSVVRERERGTLEQLIVTPIRSWELMLGKLLPFTIIAFLNIALVLSVGVYWFKVELVGSLPLLLVLAIPFVLTSLGFGLFFSTVSRTQAQAVQLAMFVMLPSILISGFLYPRESMPEPLSDLGLLIPLTYFLKILRSIILKGVGLDILWREALPLTIYGFGIFTFAVSRFRKTLG